MCQSIVKRQPNFCVFSTFCFSAGAQRSMHGWRDNYVPHRYLTKPDTIARSFKAGGRYAMTALCRLFRSDGWRYCRGASLQNRVGRLDGFPHTVAERTFSTGNNIGEVLSVILLQWLNLNNIINICCNRFILLEPIC